MRLGTAKNSSGVRTATYVAQGTDDDAVDPVTAEMLLAQLRPRGKRVR